MESLKKLNSTSIVIQADEKFWKRMDIFFLFVIILLLTWAGQGQGQEYKKCDADEYQCFNGECIDADYFCDFTPDCADNSDETFCFLECISSDDLRGDFYQGKRNITWSGRPCQRYDQQSPHEHNFGYLASHSDNYCRNDDDSPVPWCYTLDPKVRWEICNIPRCKEYELGSCSFETDMCGWKQPRNSIPWNRQIDWMDSSEEETILVLDTSMETPTNHSLLISPTIRPSLDVTCLGISFYTYGSGVQNIYIHVSYGMDELKLASEAKRIKKSMWHQTYISLSERTKFGIVIKAEISDLDAGGIAIGDLSLDLGICEGLDLCTTSQYQCDDWTCIDVHKFCDGIANCPDSSDEANCHIHCLPDYDKHGLKYNGQLNVTKSGRICQRWNSIVPHNHSYHKLRENYCRNPNEKSRPWCFTTDPNLRWEYCDVPKCDGECLQKDDTEGTSYDGRLNMTSSGRQCQRWDTQTPHEHEELFHDEENYCRNNGDAVNIWCLTMDPEVNWEFCTLPTCEPSRCRPDDHSCQERLRMQKATRSVELGVIVDNDACWDGIMCRDSNICVPKEKICDGIYQCPLYDDEMSCNMSCPVHCTCMGLILDCSFTCSIVANLPVEVRTLNISGAMFTLSMLFVDKLPFLIHLNITKTNLLAINDDDIFANKLQCDNLQTLYLTHNEITTISRYAFARLFRLRELHLDGNPILILQHDMFNQLHNLIYLSVTETQIRNLSKGTFDGLLQLKKINLDSNKIEIIESESLHSLKEISNIYLDHNNLTVLDNFFSLKMTELVVLDMSHNQIQNITSSSLEGLYYLEHLDLSNNKLEIIPENAFIFLQALLRLNISFNNIKVIETSAFEGLVSVRSLDLQGNKLEYIAAGVFRGLKTVTFINLNSNLLHHIEHRTFMDVSELSVLYLQNNKLTVYEEMFYGLCKLVTIHADTYRICCARPPSVLPQNCVAPTYTISSCNHLIDVGLLSVAIWLIAIFTLGGNAFVTIYRCTTIKKRKSNPHIVFILNLSISDFVMGIYLMIIAVADLQFRGDYGYKDLEWRNSATCTISGVLATVSSETSAILLFVITIDRLIALKFPFSKFKFTFRISVTISIIVWILSGILAILPLLLFDSYYAESSVCVSLPLSTYQDVGREYSMGLFIFFNLSLFLGIVAGQLVIYLEVRRVEKNVKKERSMEIAVARTLITLALTDALCWIPIAILGILTQNGIGISSTVYAWVVVLVLPINSALNPFLYTFSEVRAERRRLQMKSEIHGKLSHSADQT